MKTFGRRMALAKSVLSKLADTESMRWVALVKEVLRNGGTPHTFQSILQFLLDNEYVTRRERGVYEITKKGRDFLEVII